jgi:hypothetical protein
MRNLLALCGAAVITFACAGWYLDWFRVHPAPSSEEGKRSFQIEVNKNKISEDLHKGGSKLQGLLEKTPPTAIPGEKLPVKPMDTTFDEAHQVKTEEAPLPPLPDLLPPGPPVPPLPQP